MTATSLASDIPRTERRHTTTPARHRFFDEWLIPTGPALKEIAAGLVDHVEGLEAASPDTKRRRARRPADQTSFEEMVRIVAANLAYAVLKPPASGKLAVNGGQLARRRTRYDNPALGKQYPRTLRLLDDAGLVRFLPPETIRGEKSSLAPTAEFARLVEASGVTFADFGRHPNEELIRLTRRGGTETDATRELVDFVDTPESDAMRAAIRALNRFLAAADITFEDDGRLPIVDPNARRLVRRFSLREGEAPHFGRGGRLFGGFWTNLERSRRHSIRIGGEPVADLDYRSMFVRLAYAHVGKEPPAGDLYALPGLEGYRSGVKLAINALFWDDNLYRKTWPEKMGIGMGSDDDARQDPQGEAAAFEHRLPAGWESVARMKGVLLDSHPELKPVVGRGVGGTLMRRESEVMMTVLGELMRRDVVALPLHDGLMVGRSKERAAEETMRRVALEMTGIEFPVSMETV